MSRRLLTVTYAAGTALCLASPWARAQTPPTPAVAAPSTAASATLAPVTISAQPAGRTLHLDEPSATASRLNLTPRQTPASVYAVDRDEIEQRGYADTQAILRGVPGVTASSPPGSPGSVFYRGFGSSSLTQLFNGISVQYDAIAARPIDSWIIDRVEVIGGPSSYLFGAGAVGGSINYLSKLPVRDSDFVQGRLSYGRFNTVNLSAGVNQRFGHAKAQRNVLRVDVNQSHSDGWVDGERRDATTAAASLLSDLTPRLSHTLAVEYQHERVERPYWGTPVLTPVGGRLSIDEGLRFKNYNSADGRYEQRIRWGRSIVEYRLSDRTTLRNTFYAYDAQRDFQNVEVYAYTAGNTSISRGSPLLQRHDQQLVGDRVEAVHKSTLAGRPSDWSFGADYSVNRQTRFPTSLSSTVSVVNPYAFTTESFFDIPGMSRQYLPDRNNRVQTLAFYLENRTRMTDQLSLITGLRHDQIDLEVTNRRAVTATNPAYFKRNYNPTTGRIGVVFDVTPTANVYAQYSTAADPPAGILTTATFAQVQDFDLTRGRQVEVGSKFNYWQDRGVATVALYSIDRKNLSTVDPGNPNASIPVGEQSSRGIELSTSLRLTPTWLVQGQLAYTDAQFDAFSETVGGAAVSRVGNRPANVPKWVANLWTAYDLAPGWRIGADLRYVSTRYGNNANTTETGAYTLLGAFASYRVNRHLNLTLRGSNLADKVYAANVSSGQLYLGAPRYVELGLVGTY